MITTSECRNCNSVEDRIVLHPRYRIMRLWNKSYVMCGRCGIKNDIWIVGEREPLRHRVLNMMWRIENYMKINRKNRKKLWDESVMGRI